MARVENFKSLLAGISLQRSDMESFWKNKINFPGSFISPIVTCRSVFYLYLESSHMLAPKEKGFGLCVLLPSNSEFHMLVSTHTVT